MTYTRLKSKWANDLNLKRNELEENMGEFLYSLRVGKGLLNCDSKSRSRLEKKINKFDIEKRKNFMGRNIISKVKNMTN